MVEDYLGYLNRDALSAGGVTVLAATGAALSMSGWTDLYVYIFATAITVVLLAGLRGHTLTAEMWRDVMPSKPPTNHKMPSSEHQK